MSFRVLDSIIQKTMPSKSQEEMLFFLNLKDFKGFMLKMKKIILKKKKSMSHWCKRKMSKLESSRNRDLSLYKKFMTQLVLIKYVEYWVKRETQAEKSRKRSQQNSKQWKKTR